MLTNSIEIKDRINQRSVEKELLHREFTTVLNTFLENSQNMPVLIQGPKNSGKKTIAIQIGEYLGKKPKIYNFGNTTINNSPYFNVENLIDEFSKSQTRGDLIVVEDLDKMQVYDYIILLGLVKNAYAYNHSNCNFKMIILEDSNFRSTKTLSDSIRSKCITVRIDKDPVIEAKRLQEIAEKKAKEKTKSRPKKRY